MSKIAFMFPGQGAQKAGMGKDFYEQSETARKVIDKIGRGTRLNSSHVD